MTKNSSDQWSESFLKKHEIFPFQKSLVVFIKRFLLKNKYYPATLQKWCLIILEIVFASKDNTR